MTPITKEKQISAQAPQDLPILRVCFVCTGNTCRSPMAAAVANAMAQPTAALPEDLRQKMAPALQAYSAGLYAVAGEPISHNAVKALEEANVAAVKGLDYHKHAARTLTLEEAERFDWLVAVSERHAMELLMRFPQLASRMIQMPSAISDPYGGDLARYKACLAEITKGVQALFFSGEGV